MSAPHEAFTALDSASGSAPGAWTRIDARTAEAGYQDPALGWVTVRAQQDAAGVHATLLPGSSDAAQLLSGHLSGLDSYLAEHHTAVQTLTVAAPSGPDSGLATRQGNQEADRGRDQSANPGTNQGGNQRTNSGVDGSRAESAAPSRKWDTSEPLIHSAPGGSYVSVMA
jgi:hypothetical protein